MNRAELRQILIEHRVPVLTWGQGVSKTLEHLLNEINEGESTLVKDGETLVKKESGVTVTVLYSNGEQSWKLVEEKQVFSDGRERARGYTGSIGEKMRSGEEPIAAARRALSEELGFENTDLLISDDCPFETDHRPILPSQSYPGLMTRRTVYEFILNLPGENYTAEGYQEVQPDKTTYFRWQEI
jgi:8-oxo-dGTP pyrophosphatase MutT (NUDIX family)